jgi:hypothetical protein
MSPIGVVLLSVPPATEGLHTPPFWALCRLGLGVDVDTRRDCLVSIVPPATEGLYTATRGPSLALAFSCSNTSHGAVCVDDHSGLNWMPPSSSVCFTAVEPLTLTLVID